MLATVDPGPVPPHVQAAVTTTSSLHAAGAVAGVALVHVLVEAFEWERRKIN